jgi:hypothetical protein
MAKPLALFGAESLATLSLEGVEELLVAGCSFAGCSLLRIPRYFITFVPSPSMVVVA